MKVFNEKAYKNAILKKLSEGSFDEIQSDSGCFAAIVIGETTVKLRLLDNMIDTVSYWTSFFFKKNAIYKAIESNGLYHSYVRSWRINGVKYSKPKFKTIQPESCLVAA